jgi:hypothetical protein
MPLDSLIVSGTVSANFEVKISGSVIDPASYIHRTIDSFGALPRGWDYGRGGPIPEKTLQIARRWNDALQLNGFMEVEAFPGEQEVLLAVSDGDHYFEVIIEADNTITVAYDFQRQQVFYKPHMTEKEAWRSIAEIMGRKWSASGCFTRVDTMGQSTNLPDLRFVIPPKMDVYLSSTGIASRLQDIQLAIISESTTKADLRMWSGNLLFFGNLIQPRHFPSDIG